MTCSPVIGRKIEDVLQKLILGLIFSNFRVYLVKIHGSCIDYYKVGGPFAFYIVG
jgi:hypothetical protein